MEISISGRRFLKKNLKTSCNLHVSVILDRPVEVCNFARKNSLGIRLLFFSGSIVRNSLDSFVGQSGNRGHIPASLDW
jgi:hypothetical protein